MPQDQKPKKLASYKTMMELWRAELRSALRDAGFTAIGMTVVLALLRIVISPKEPLLGLSWTQWVALSFAIAIVGTIPVISMKVGPMPRPRDVEVNRAMRRACGMDDTVEDDDAR